MNNLMLQRFAGVPSIVAPVMKERFEACLNAVLGHPRAEEMLFAQAGADDSFWPPADDWRAGYRPYVVVDGILQIPVKGVLLHDFPWAIGTWATGYAYIARAVERGLSDQGVRALAFICDTPGGEVAGCFELVDKIFAARGQKPMRSFAHESACSAGYAVAAAADHVAVSRTGVVGSIGVVTMHVDMSGALEQAGYRITFIHAPEGGHKVDGNPYQPLPVSVKERVQTRVNSLYDIFVASVSRCRNLDDSAVRATKALCFTAREAMDNGLTDSVGPLDDAVAAFNTNLSSNDEGDDEMNDKTNAAALEAARAEGHAQGHAEGMAAGKTEGEKAGAIAACSRAKTILDHAEAKGREDLARHLAFDTDMSAEAAVAMLGKAPKAAAATPSRLSGDLTPPNPAVTSGEKPLDAGSDLNAAVDAMVASRAKRVA
ncbi:S49 family peptidase [Nitrobacter sp.]|uniref:S49 family peptidase n=1 Tax=Nitrobacter sp. TaxID=29420 RepID=UPI003F64AE67